MCRSDQNSKTSAQVRQTIVDNFTQFNTQTLDEDRAVVETCQQNMPQNTVPGWLGECEARIVHFHQSWREDMQQTITSTKTERDHA
jgi:phenylpropionate dioxygenase-like ring-hydroxylating dioxygenase large terminal subunit